MVDFDSSAKKLYAKRQALLDELAAIDRALTALAGAGIAGPNNQEGHTVAAAEKEMSPVVPTRIKPPRVQSDAHRHASIEGRRRARHSKEAAAGRAREMPNQPARLASAAEVAGPPRLVKRKRHYNPSHS
jgi:hypothetical protein